MSELSIIAANHRVVGTVSAAEDLVVQGRVEGRILSDATLVIDATAIVEGEVLARHVIVRGVVVGDVSAVEQIEVAPSGQILGDLKTRRLALKAGGRISGLVHTGVEVAAHSATPRTGNTWRPTARPATAPTANRGWTEEVVETSRNGSAAAAIDAAKKAKKEPSREAI